MRNLILVLCLIPLLCAGALAQAPAATLKVAQTTDTTTLTVAYSAPAPMNMLPQLVFLGIGTTAGETKIPFTTLPFITNDLVFKLQDAVIMPIGVLDPKGELTYTIPVGTAGATTHKLYLQANVLDLTIKMGGPNAFPLTGTFYPTPVSKELTFGVKAKP